ncbi:MAG: helix-turn-helix transcriptional regulator [Lachnospiraceae bacterium]|nr:helix-turn-helix transcriptional regulator [Lachnospiraceae bacterium]
MSMAQPNLTYHTPTTIGKRIREERKKLGMTQAQLSKVLGISTSYLGALERGSRSISSNILSKLHKHLNLSYDYLLEGTTLQDLSLQQYIRESTDYDYGVRHDLDVVLGTCTEAELEACYELIRTYLLHSRSRSNKKIRRQSESPDSHGQH